jgi:hypothetical protein
MRSRIQYHKTMMAVYGFAIFLLVFALPVSAAAMAANGTVIGQGAVLFIGEEGLNVTHAMNQAFYLGLTGSAGTKVQNNSPLQTNATRIGWWPSAAILYTTSPSKVIDLGVEDQYKLMNATPGYFVGYTGNWYLLNEAGARPIGTSPDECLVFSVQTPALDFRVWDYNQNTDVTGMSVPSGEKLGFRLDTNMYPAVDGRYRSNIIDDSLEGTWPVYTGSDYAWNNLLENSTVDTWLNGTLMVLTNPDQPCCPIYRDVYVERFWNYSGEGAWMTWADGYHGCNLSSSQVFFYNSTSRWLFDNATAYFKGFNYSGWQSDGVVREYFNYCDQAYPVAATDGFIDLATRDEGDNRITVLYNQSEADTALVPGPYTVLGNFADNQPFFWGSGLATPVHLNSGNQPYDGHVWATGARNNSSRYIYPAGTFTIRAESTLNNMRANYNPGPGADFTGETVSAYRTITIVPVTGKIGVVRSNTSWLLDASGNGAFGAGDRTYTFGKAGDVPVTGDWDGDGTTEIGVVRSSTSWLLDKSGDGKYGAGDLSYSFGKAGDVPVTGDWDGDRTTEIGVVRSGTSWLLDRSGDGKYGAGDLSYAFGKAGDKPVTGDWDGDGTTEIGVVRSNTTWLLDKSGDGKYGAGDLTYTFGKASDVPVASDWNADGTTEIGVVRSGASWLLDKSGDGKYGAGDLSYAFGKAGDKPVTGAW